MAGEEHGEGVGGEKGEVEFAESVGPLRSIKWGPPGVIRAVGSGSGAQNGFDDRRGLAGGVEGGVGDEGENEDGNLVKDEGFFRSPC